MRVPLHRKFRSRLVELESRITPAPVVQAITRGDPSPTNAAAVSYLVQFSEPVWGVDISDFALTATGLSNASISAVNGSTNSYTVTVHPGAGDGTLRLDLLDDDSIVNMFGVPLGGVGAGNGNFLDGDVYVIDRTPPEVTLSSASTPTVLGSFTVNVTFSESVTGLSNEDVVVSNGLLREFTGSGDQYTLVVVPAAAGNVRVDIPANSASDPAGNGNAAGLPLTRYHLTASAEFIANTTTAGSQVTTRHSAAVDAIGNALVVWSSFDGSGEGIYGQRFDQNGARVGGEFLINTYTAGQQTGPAIAKDADGNALVAWSSYDQDDSKFGVYAQRYNSAGAKVGGEFRVNDYTTDSQKNPSIAMDADGDAVVVWLRYSDFDTGSKGISAQRYDAAGSKVGGEIVVTSDTAIHESVDVAMDAAGNVMIVWEEIPQVGSGFDIFARRYDPAGLPAGGAFQVNTFSAGFQSFPAVAMDADGDAIVVWQSYGPVGDLTEIYAQRFAPTGTKVGPEFQVNTFTTGSQQFANVGMPAGGEAIITWRSFGQDGSGWGVYGQRFDPAGERVAGEFRVNDFTTNNQISPTVALDAQGSALVVWSSFGQDGSDFAVVGRRLAALDPTPPSVVDIRINDGGLQRSRVTSLTVTFSQLVDLSADALQLIRTGPGGATGPVTLAIDTSESTPTQTIARLTFSGSLTHAGSLIDGRYTLNVAGAEFSNPAGLAGDDATLDLHRLFGDADGDGDVDITDFNRFRLAFGSLVPSSFDFDGDGDVDASDFARFRLRFGATV